MEGGAGFGFSGGRHHVVENLGDGEDRFVERGAGDWWLGRVGRLVAKEVVATDGDESSGSGNLGGFDV